MKKNNKKKIKNTEHTREIAGIIITSIGILSFISLINNKTGIVGMFLRSILFNLFGFGGFIFPLIITIVGILLVMNRFNIWGDIKSVYLLVLFFCFLALVDINAKTGTALPEKISYSLGLGKEGLGGGLVGAFLGYLLNKLFGPVGSYIVIIILILIFMLLLTEIGIKRLMNKVRIKNKKSIDLRAKTKPKEIVALNKKTEFVSQEIAIHDHTKKELESGNNDFIDNEMMISNSPVTMDYCLPPLELLNSPINKNTFNEKEVLYNAKAIEETMLNFGISANIIQINRGPTITCYELQPAPGVKVSRIVNLADDLSLNLATSDIRIEAPVPGKAVVGIEVPNKVKEIIGLKEMFQSREYITQNDIPLLLGKDISGTAIVSSIEKMPHLLIAGATGSGKSACINTIIMGLLYKVHPDEVKLLIIDPKVVELNVYNGIPHLLIPVVTEPKKAASALSWAVGEMERRYKAFAKNNAKDIKTYNNGVRDKSESLPSIIVIIDELADLMMVAAQEIEDLICRLAQMARAAGIYLIVATQRPSVDVITGSIKANIPSRISFAVSSQIDSRTILDMTGAEKLLGKGDMLFFPSFLPKAVRIQGAYARDIEIQRVVDYLKSKNTAQYDNNVIETMQNETEITRLSNYDDELLSDAAYLVIEEGQASISLLQRKLRIGYARAARIVDEMEELGIVGGHEGSKPRKVLMPKEAIDSIFEINKD